MSVHKTENTHKYENEWIANTDAFTVQSELFFSGFHYMYNKVEVT